MKGKKLSFFLLFLLFLFFLLFSLVGVVGLAPPPPLRGSVRGGSKLAGSATLRVLKPTGGRGETRTLTGLIPQGPKPCVSTNSTTRPFALCPADLQGMPIPPHPRNSITFYHSPGNGKAYYNYSICQEKPSFCGWLVDYDLTFT